MVALDELHDHQAFVPDPLPPGQERSFLSFSPDGKRLTWYQTPTDTAAKSQLWVGNADFSDARMLLVGDVDEGPIWSPDGTRLIVSTTDFHMELVPVDGGDVEPLARAAGTQTPIAWHRDGDRVAYLSTAGGGTLLTSVVSVRTGKSSPLIPGVTLPHIGNWSPDGSMIAYQVIDGGHTTIWLADSTGGNRRQLTTEGFESFGQSGFWSPDGKSLLYESNRTGKRDLWTIPVDSGPPRQLTRDVASDASGAWSSDGRWVAFISDRGRQTDLWVVSAAGGDARRVSNSKEVESEQPVWRPGTNELLFTDFTSRRTVVRIDVADGAERDLLGDSLLVDELTLSRDGRQLAVVVGRGGGNKDLLLLPSDGGPIRALITSGGNIAQARWSPDGSKIAYQSDLRGTVDIFIVEVASAAVRPVTDWAGFESWPQWNRTGSALYFVANRDSRLNDVWAVPTEGGEPQRITRNGGMFGLDAGAGIAEFLVGVVGQRSGELGIARLDADNSLHTVYDRSNAFPVDASPLGDSLVIMVAQGSGEMVPMLVPITGGAGRQILAPNLSPLEFAPDGRRLIYQFKAGGLSDLGIVDLRDGSRREITHSPANEGLASWLPDGKAIVARRSLPTTRVIFADLSSIMAVPK